jgi:predicted amidophosphoribosyltransferase
MDCPKCGTQNDAADRLCKKCAAPLAAVAAELTGQTSATPLDAEHRRLLLTARVAQSVRSGWHVQSSQTDYQAVMAKGKWRVKRETIAVDAFGRIDVRRT